MRDLTKRSNMKILFIFLSFLVMGCSMSYEGKDQLKGGTSSETYIVKTVKSFDASQFENVGGVYDGREPVTNLLIDGEFYTIKRDVNTCEDMFLKKIEALSGVYYVEKNKKVESTKFHKGTRPSQSILHPFGLDNGNLKEDPDAMYYEYALRITQARDFFDDDGNKQQGAYTKVGYGNNKTVLAIIDSGLNMKHPDFTVDSTTSRCLYAKSYYKAGTAQVVPVYDTHGKNEDDLGHGTHCSGTMCAVQGNGEGIAGVAYKNSYLISYRSITAQGGNIDTVYGALGDLAQMVNILRKEVSVRTAEEKAMIPSSVPADFVIRQKTIPVNMSLGSYTTGDFEVEMMNLAIKNNILPIVAMGNDGRMQPAYPRSIYGCVAVGATDNKDKRAYFSDAGEWMSVCAPGADIISTYNGNWVSGLSSAQLNTDKTGTRFMSGTSMATPFVTGMIAYLLSFDAGQNLSPYQVKKLLEDTADKIDSDNPDFGKYVNGHSLYYGFGRVNVLKAASSVAGKEGAAPIPPANSFYVEKPMVITAPFHNLRIRLYEVLDGGELFPQGLAITNSTRVASFYGLKKGAKYKLTCDVYGREKEHEFVATDEGEMKYEFKF